MRGDLISHVWIPYSSRQLCTVLSHQRPQAGAGERTSRISTRWCSSRRIGDEAANVRFQVSSARLCGLAKHFSGTGTPKGSSAFHAACASSACAPPSAVSWESGPHTISSSPLSFDQWLVPRQVRCAEKRERTHASQACPHKASLKHRETGDKPRCRTSPLQHYLLEMSFEPPMKRRGTYDSPARASPAKTPCTLRRPPLCSAHRSWL